jgi:2-polyprenyl-6-methoxyphenol hydroxylase-like FAD-dependent oxidoreductase
MEHPRHRHPRCGAGDRWTVSDDPAPELRRRRRRGIALLGAGLAAALYGARAGLDVAIVERRSGVLDKACGDGMMPYTVVHVDRLGVAAHGRPLRGTPTSTVTAEPKRRSSRADRAAGPLRQRVGHRMAGRMMLVGDAAGYIHALTGEGMGLAFGATEPLVDCRARPARGLPSSRVLRSAAAPAHSPAAGLRRRALRDHQHQHPCRPPAALNSIRSRPVPTREAGR